MQCRTSLARPRSRLLVCRCELLPAGLREVVFVGPAARRGQRSLADLQLEDRKLPASPRSSSKAQPPPSLLPPPSRSSAVRQGNMISGQPLSRPCRGGREAHATFTPCPMWRRADAAGGAALRRPAFPVPAAELLPRPRAPGAPPPGLTCRTRPSPPWPRAPPPPAAPRAPARHGSSHALGRRRSQHNELLMGSGEGTQPGAAPGRVGSGALTRWCTRPLSSHSQLTSSSNFLPSSSRTLCRLRGGVRMG
jgi:hypothetical protein